MTRQTRCGVLQPTSISSTPSACGTGWRRLWHDMMRLCCLVMNDKHSVHQVEERSGVFPGVQAPHELRLFFPSSSQQHHHHHLLDAGCQGGMQGAAGHRKPPTTSHPTIFNTAIALGCRHHAAPLIKFGLPQYRLCSSGFRTSLLSSSLSSTRSTCRDADHKLASSHPLLRSTTINFFVLSTTCSQLPCTARWPILAGCPP